jgi:soluble lytic murein transglycosylase
VANYNRKRSRIGLILLVLTVLLLIAGSNWVGKIFYPFPYQDIIAKEAAKYDLDPLLVAAVIKAESNFEPRAVSVKGARGVMQIMPETGEWIAKQMGIKGFQAADMERPSVNIKLGCWYLANLFKEFQGDPVLVLAAYNGGRGNVRQWLAEKRWSGNKSTLEQIPFPETRQYVDKVLKNHRIYRKLYGKKMVSYAAFVDAGQ